MSSPQLKKIAQWTLILMLAVLLVVAFVPPQIAQAATTSPHMSAKDVEPLTATVPTPATAPIIPKNANELAPMASPIVCGNLETTIPATTSSYFTDAVPSATISSTTAVLHKELYGYGNYGVPDHRSDILYAGQAATWHFTLPTSIDPATVENALFRVSIVADDHYGVPLSSYTLSVWSNDSLLVSNCPADLPHGTPYGGTFNNWVQRDYETSGSPSTYTITIANRGGGAWIAVDWIELHFSIASPIIDRTVNGAAGTPGCSGCPAENWAPATQEYTNNPINTRTGNLSYSSTDLSLPTQSGSLSFSRSYTIFNARDVAANLLPSSPLGVGWTHNYNVYLIFPTDPGGEPGKLLMHLAEGSRIGFTDQGSGIYTTDAGAGGTLTRTGIEGSYVYTYTNSQDIKYIFRNDGKLTELDNGRGQSLELGYTGSQLDFVATDVVSGEPAGRYLEFTYTSGKLTGVADSAGRSVAYDYTGSNLTSFTDVRGEEWTYEYENTSYPNFVTARLDPLGQTIVSYDYDTQGRAYRETGGDGQVMVELAFNTNGTTTVIQGEDGVGGEETHEYDNRHTLTDQGNIAGSSVTHYAPSFRPDQVTDANGNDTLLEWSDDGSSLVGVTDELGHSTDFQYDDRHHLELVTNADETQTLFVYNTEGATNPLTSQEIDDQDWDEDVLLLQIDNYQQGQSGADVNLPTRYFYTDASDAPQPPNLVERVEAPGGTTCYAYNEFGQQTEVVQDCDGEDITTSYSYDTAGRMVDTTDSLGKVTHYVYIDSDDRADEVISNYDVSRDPYEDGIYNLSTRTFLDASGRVVATVSNYNAGTIQGGTAVSFDFDDDEVTDVTLPMSIEAPEYNQVSLTRYDAAVRAYESIANYWQGQADYYLNKYNVHSRSFYDGAGRVVATVSNYNEANLPGGGSPQTIDFDGDAENDTALEISPDAPEFNRISRTIYDSAGRVSKTISTAWPGQPDYYLGVYNLVSATEYDAAGNVLVTITNFDQSVSGGYSVPLDLVPDPDATPDTTIHVDPAVPDRNQITCTGYDALNRPVFTHTACVPGQADYLVAGDNLYNLVNATYYDEMGRQIASVRNYEDNGASSTDGILELTATRNFISRTYYDGLGRAEYVVENFAGDIANPVVPTYNPDYPDRNLVTRTYYDADGRQVAVVRNYLDPSASDDLTQSDILNGDTGDSEEDTDLNLVSLTYYNTAGQVAYSVENFVGDLATAIAPSFDPAMLSGLFSTSNPDRNLLTRYTYDDAGRRYETTIERGSLTRTTHTTFDELGRTSATIANYQLGAPAAPDVNVTTGYAYDALGRISEVTDPANRVRRSISEQLDTVLGRTSVSITDPADLALTSTSISNAAGQTTRSIDASGRIAETTFDAQGRAVETVTDPGTTGLALTSSTTYDLLGRAVTSTDAEGVVTRYQYNNLGQVVMKLENFSGGTPTCIRQANVADDTDVCTTYAYDQAGNLVSRVLGNTSSTAYAYDARGQITLETVDPNGLAIATAYAYDAAGNQVTLTLDPGGTPQVTATVYDRLRHITHVDYAGEDKDVDYTYDAWGNRHEMVDAGGTWTYLYDAMNRLTSVTDPDQQAVTYAYNAAGNRVTLTYPDTTSVSYVYDNTGRLDTVSNPFGAGIVDYGYDGAGRVTSAALPGAVPDMTYTYDPAGRLIELVNGLVEDPTSRFIYTLNDNGSRTDAAEGLDLPIPAAPTPTPTTTETVTATPSETPTITPTASETPTLTPTLEFTPTETSTPEATATETASPTPSETPTETATVTATETPTETPMVTETAALTPTATGSPMPTPPSLPGEETGSHQWHYEYDGLKRLTYACSEWNATTEACDGDEFWYFYDGAGNILKMIRPDTGTTLYTYNGANEIATACTDANTNNLCDPSETQVTYQHDAYGNLTNDGRYEYVYDVTNHLVELKMSEQTVATSVYNGDGDLISATVLEVTTKYVRDWASPEKVVLTETTGTNVTRNLYGMGLIAQQLPGGEVQYALFDGMRSIRQFVGTGGVVTYAQTFDPFGGMYASAGGSTSDYGFMGLQGLKQSPLLYYNGQWYHTGTGRFVQPQKRLPNPYVPLLGFGLSGVGLIALPRLRKKKWAHILLLLLTIGLVGMLLTSCNLPGGGTTPPTSVGDQPNSQPGGPTDTSGGSEGTTSTPPANTGGSTSTAGSGEPPNPSPTPCPTPGLADDSVAVTLLELTKAGGVVNYLRQEGDNDAALLVTRVAMGETELPNALDRQYVAWLIKMRAELGYPRLRHTGDTLWRWGEPVKISDVVLAPSQFEIVSLAIENEGIDPGSYRAEGNLRAMMSPTDEQRSYFEQTYQDVKRILAQPLSQMPAEIKGYEHYVGRNSPDADLSIPSLWIGGGGLPRKQPAGPTGNVFIDDNPIDNIALDPKVDCNTIISLIPEFEMTWNPVTTLKQYTCEK